MTEFAASRFPRLAAPEPPPKAPAQGLGLTISVVPIPLGEVMVLLTAWLLILPV